MDSLIHTDEVVKQGWSERVLQVLEIEVQQAGAVDFIGMLTHLEALQLSAL